MTLDGMFESLKNNGFVRDSEPGDVHHWDSDDKDHRKQPDGSWPVVGSEEDKIKEESKYTIKATKADIDNLQSISVEKGGEQLPVKKLETIYKNLPDGHNKKDGCAVEFVHSSFGKIVGHGNELIKTVIPYLTDIFNNSIPLHDSNYRSEKLRRDGSTHKEHDNFKGYHNYLGKVKIDNEEYFVRFTLQETTSKKAQRNQFHDLFVSDVELYKNKTAGSRNLPDNNRTTDEPRGLDKILNEVLEKVNKNQTHDHSLIDLWQMMKGA